MKDTAVAGAASLPTGSLAGAAPQSTSTEPRWNTRNLGWRIGSDALSAATAGALVAPIISIIDRSIMENASGRRSLSASIRSSLRTLLVRPHALLLSRPTALVFILYSGTYLTANAVDTATSTLDPRRPAHAVTSGPTKFLASSAANVGLCVYKDQVFVRMFGPVGAAPRPVPLACSALFTLRDCLTIFASFNVPPLLAPRIDASLAASSSDLLARHLSGSTIAQFLSPAAVQLISTPMHLLGLDMYNRPASGAAAISWRDRFEIVRKNWLISATARIGRIVPAFGVGGVVNMKVRRTLMDRVG